MDTNRLKRFATEARTILMQGVVHRFTALGFLPDGNVTEEPVPMGGGATFMGDTVSEDFYQKWCSLQRAVEAHGIREVAEEAAYTWFNRLMAIRIMVKNGLISPVLQYESEGINLPLLVSEARQGRMPDMSANDRRKLEDLLPDDSKTAEQFRILIVAFCHATPVIDRCFGHIADYTELLLPANILAEGGFVDMLNNTDFIAEDDFRSPELIGWLYQFYIADRKDEAFAKKGKYDPDEIAPATQIFTPNWIVKYMVQNTIGRIYLDNNPYEDELKEKWKYLVEPSEPTPEEAIFHLDDLKDLTAADLACGSGHILNEAFDLLYDLYINEGYSRRQAIEHIFHYNLLGIDIDTRAKQLATFALMLKACQRDGSFADCRLMPRVYDMPRPIHEVLPGYGAALPQFLMGANQTMVKELVDALQLMNHADTLGSIMKFELSESTRNTVMIRVQEYEEQLAQGEIVTEENRLLLPYMRIILALTDHYAALCMNPPYMGSGRFDATLSQYVKDNYPKSKADLFAVFMDVAIDRLADCGKYSMINMHSWMFLSSFEDLRRSLLDNEHIDSLLHLGPRTFDELSGEVVQNAAFVISKASSLSESHQTNVGTYFRLIDGRNCADKERLFLNAKTLQKIYYPNVAQENFEKIPGCPIGYWVSEKKVSIFDRINRLRTSAHPAVGFDTQDNGRFLRFLWEIDYKKYKVKWYACTKGGPFRKWYGNVYYCVNWENNGAELKSAGANIRNSQYYLKRKGASWSTLASGKPSFRFFSPSWLFENKGSVCFPNTDDTLYYLMGFLNSCVTSDLLGVLAPTLDFSQGSIGRIPFKIELSSTIDSLVCTNIAISKADWDSHETSWDFEANPLVALRNEKVAEGGRDSSFRVKDLVAQFEAIWEQRFNQLHENEEELNRQFISIYGLQDELTPDVPLDEITILQQGEISIEKETK